MALFKGEDVANYGTKELTKLKEDSLAYGLRTEEPNSPYHYNSVHVVPFYLPTLCSLLLFSSAPSCPAKTLFHAAVNRE